MADRIPIPVEIPWESHGNPVFPIPMHISSLYAEGHVSLCISRSVGRRGLQQDRLIASVDLAVGAAVADVALVVRVTRDRHCHFRSGGADVSPRPPRDLAREQQRSERQSVTQTAVTAGVRRHVAQPPDGPPAFVDVPLNRRRGFDLASSSGNVLRRERLITHQPHHAGVNVRSDDERLSCVKVKLGYKLIIVRSKA